RSRTMRTEFQDWPVRTGFFLYGALSHLLVFRLYVEWSFGPGANREVADHALTNMAVTLLGGAFVLLLMPGPLLRAVRKPSPRIAVILKAAGLGALVTFIVVQALFVLGSLF